MSHVAQEKKLMLMLTSTLKNRPDMYRDTIIYDMSNAAI